MATRRRALPWLVRSRCDRNRTSAVEMPRMNGIAKHARRMTALLALVGCFAAGIAMAQAPCPEGQTASGRCVKPRLAEGARSNVEGLSQGKISYTSPPWLPSEDRHNPATPQWHEMLNLFTGPPVTRPVTTGTIPGSRLAPTSHTFQVGRP
jgi:hypothetical protein